MQSKRFISQCANDAEDRKYGDYSYWLSLEISALEKAAYYANHGMHETAKYMLTRSLGEALSGNDGE